ncbi:MAG: gephyrin-like molybdotransferase Glp [Thermodesulfobacteriota bacterium]|nr:gephyrin-like molybdotransferase Glp [Thermodesulfobacteriota bacterium]
MQTPQQNSLADRSLISLEEARQIIGEIEPLAPELVHINDGVGRITATDTAAVSDCPSTDASLKDGFAVVSADIDGASRKHPVTLQVVGTLTAGQDKEGLEVSSGNTVRIMTGAAVPQGADAVLTSEFAELDGDRVTIFRDAHPGRNILEHGHDVRSGEVLIRPGTRLRAAHIGLLAAAGISEISVYRQPKIVIVATGSELVKPGNPIAPGKVAASNLVTLQAALRDLGMESSAVIIHDDLQNLQQQMMPLLEKFDVMLTCGGVLDGDKDLTMRAMDFLKVEPVFRRVRVGPGKGICFGRRDETLIFNLPGGPPSNHIAFLLLALPGIQRLSGYRGQYKRVYTAELTCPLHGQTGWTEIMYGALQRVGEKLQVTPVQKRSRLLAMAAADCLIELPEDRKEADTGESVRIWKIR